MKIPDLVGFRICQSCKYESEHVWDHRIFRNKNHRKFLFTKNPLYFSRIFVDFSRIFRKRKYDKTVSQIVLKESKPIWWLRLSLLIWWLWKSQQLTELIGLLEPGTRIFRSTRWPSRGSSAFKTLRFSSFINTVFYFFSQLFFFVSLFLSVSSERESDFSLELRWRSLRVPSLTVEPPRGFRLRFSSFESSLCPFFKNRTDFSQNPSNFCRSRFYFLSFGFCFVNLAMFLTCVWVLWRFCLSLGFSLRPRVFVSLGWRFLGLWFLLAFCVAVFFSVSREVSVFVVRFK